MYVDLTSNAEIRFTDEHAPYSVLDGASTGYGREGKLMHKLVEFGYATIPAGYGKFDE